MKRPPLNELRGELNSKAIKLLEGFSSSVSFLDASNLAFESVTLRNLLRKWWYKARLWWWNKLYQNRVHW